MSNTLAPRPLLRNVKYLYLMSAQAISNLGDWLYILALFMLVGFRWHASPLVISLMMLCLTGPMAILGPFTGLLADRWNRTVLMIVSNLVLAVLVGIIPWLPTRWLVFVVLILVGAFQSLFNPAESGKLKEIVPDAQMQHAASINSSIIQLTKVIGPGMSGFLVAAFGWMSAFWLDSLSFVLSTLLLLLTGFQAVANQHDRVEPLGAVDGQTAPSVQAPKPTVRQRFMEGMQHILSVRVLWVGTLVLTVALLLVQLTDAQLVTLIRIIPGATSGLMGLVMGLSGAGGLLAAVLTSVIKWQSATRVMALGSVGIGLGLGFIPLVATRASHAGQLGLGWMAVISVLSVVIGACAGFVFIPFQVTAQRNTPSDMTGRVFGTIGSLTTAAALLGPALGGIIVTAIGIITAFLITAVALIIMGITVLVLHRWLTEGTTVLGETETTAPL